MNSVLNVDCNYLKFFQEFSARGVVYEYVDEPKIVEQINTKCRVRLYEVAKVSIISSVCVFYLNIVYGKPSLRPLSAVSLYSR